MRMLVARVNHAKLEVEGNLISKIGSGYIVYFGVKDTDTIELAEKCALKLNNMRLLHDEDGKMNLKLDPSIHEILVVSQFTLCGDCKKGTRPSFDKSAPPQIANELYENFVEEIKNYGIPTQTGKFAAMMDVELINDGPVTFMIET